MTWFERLLAHFFPVVGTPALPTRRQLARDTLFQMGFDLSGALDARYLIIHHSESADTGTSQFEAIRRFHMAPKPEGRGWDDIAYNGLVENVGGSIQIRPGRKLNTIGTHTKGYNDKSFAFCAVGNFDLVSPSIEIWEAMVRLTSLFQDAFDIKTEAVVGHRETALCDPDKYCPGSKWDMTIMRRNLSARRLA